MITIDTPIKFNDKLPDEVDVVIIGGGIIGILSALNMTRKGLKVIVLEKGRIAGEQSSRNWGWIRQQGRDPAELPIMMESRRLWEEIDKEVKGRTGFKQQGVFYLSNSEKEQEKREAWLEVAKLHGLESYAVAKSDISQYFQKGSLTKDFWHGAVYTPSDCKAEPWKAVPAIAELAHSEGVIIKENCAVRGLDIDNEQIKGVITELGIIKTSQVVLAAGAWSSLFLRKHGVNIPQLSVRATVAQTEPLTDFSLHNCADQELAFRRRADGGYSLALTDYEQHLIGRDSFRSLSKWAKTAIVNYRDISLGINDLRGGPDSWLTNRNWENDQITPFEQTRVLNPTPTKGKIKVIQQRFAKRFPRIGEPKLLKTWAGMIDAMPDIVPTVDKVPQIDGLILATGMSGHGFGIGPAFGKIIAQMVCSEEIEHDLSRFRFSRFTDGSPLVIGPGI